jgi:hypothetical protein
VVIGISIKSSHLPLLSLWPNKLARGLHELAFTRYARGGPLLA